VFQKEVSTVEYGYFELAFVKGSSSRDPFPQSSGNSGRLRAYLLAAVSIITTKRTHVKVIL